MAKAANNLQYVPFQQIHRLFASRANPIARYARMVGTSAYGLGACVAFFLVGQTRFARLHCSASSFLSHSGRSKLALLVCSQVRPAASPSFLNGNSLDRLLRHFEKLRHFSKTVTSIAKLLH